MFPTFHLADETDASSLIPYFSSVISTRVLSSPNAFLFFGYRTRARTSLPLSSPLDSLDFAACMVWLAGKFNSILRQTIRSCSPRRWLFAIEGCITGLIGIASWFYLPASPTQTAVKSGWNPFRSKDGWFSEQEERIMVNRIIRDDPSKGDMHNRQVSDAPSQVVTGH